jgi:hypothetical protein
VARDATARLYDVDADAIELDKKAGTIRFRAKKGRLVDLNQLHESIWATRLGDSTGMALHTLEVVLVGDVSVADKEIVLKVPGRREPFVLTHDPQEKAAVTAFGRLREALEKGEKVTTVTGVVEGWEGNFTKFLAKLPPHPRRVIVKEFQTAKP